VPEREPWLTRAVAGLLWTVASPLVAFGCLAGWMLLALTGLLLAVARRRR